jgi:hypothetical protein
MAIRKVSGLVVDEQLDVTRVANDNVIATDVQRRREKIFSTINIYIQKEVQYGETERLVRKLDWQRVIREGSTVLARDVNAHSKGSDPKCQEQSDAAFWEGVIDTNGLEIGNE